MLSDTMMLGGGRKAAYSIENSLLFRGGQYLSRTFVAPTDARKATISVWVRRGGLGTVQDIVGSSSGAVLRFGSSSSGTVGGNGTDQITLCGNSGGAYVCTTSAVFRDPSAWLHILAALDSTASAGNRVKLWVNGILQAWSVYAEPASGALFQAFMSGATLYFGSYDGANNFLGGELAEPVVIDGQALPPTKFGEFDPLTGSWRPKSVQNVDFGTNGFSLGKPWSSARSVDDLGTDYSGKGNHWTPTGFAASDVMTDSPTNVYAVVNPLSGTGGVVSNGCLRYSNNTGNSWTTRPLTVPFPSSGKWYAACDLPNNNTGFGVFTGTVPSYVGNSATSWGILYDGGVGRVWAAGVVSTTYIATSTRRHIAYDAGTGKLWLGHSTPAVWVGGGDPVAGTSPTFTGVTGDVFVGLSAYGSANYADYDYTHTPPSGFKPLCTANLPTPVSAAAKQPGKYYACKTFTTTGGVGSFTVGWNPDPANGGSHTLFRIKRINDVSNWWWIDTVRGLDKVLSSDLATAENTLTVISSVSANGTVNVSLASGYTYLVEAWRVAPEAGFDIVSYTGDGVSARALTHNLGVTPSFTIFKSRSASRHWPVWHKVFASNEGCYMNLVEAKSGSGAFTALPNASAVNLSTDNNVNALGEQYVAYIWSEVPGFSAFGKWVGTASTDGPYAHLGFVPATLLAKASDQNYPWNVWSSAIDPINTASAKVTLCPNSSVGNSTYPCVIDFLAAGTKLRSTSTTADVAGSGYNEIYAAWAAHPLGAKRVTPATAR